MRASTYEPASLQAARYASRRRARCVFGPRVVRSPSRAPVFPPRATRLSPAGLASFPASDRLSRASHAHPPTGPRLSFAGHASSVRGSTVFPSPVLCLALASPTARGRGYRVLVVGRCWTRHRARVLASPLTLLPPGDCLLPLVRFATSPPESREEDAPLRFAPREGRVFRAGTSLEGPPAPAGSSGESTVLSEGKTRPTRPMGHARVAGRIGWCPHLRPSPRGSPIFGFGACRWLTLVACSHALGESESGRITRCASFILGAPGTSRWPGAPWPPAPAAAAVAAARPTR